MYHLPNDLQQLIYQFDSTFREEFNNVIEQINQQTIWDSFDTPTLLRDVIDMDHMSMTRHLVI